MTNDCIYNIVPIEKNTHYMYNNNSVSNNETDFNLSI